jgi:hypothetical protein
MNIISTAVLRAYARTHSFGHWPFKDHVMRGKSRPGSAPAAVRCGAYVVSLSLLFAYLLRSSFVYQKVKRLHCLKAKYVQLVVTTVSARLADGDCN